MTINWARALSSVAVCGPGAFSTYVTDGATGIGWAILGILLTWGSAE